MAAIGGGYSTALVPAVEDAMVTGGGVDPVVWVERLSKRLEKCKSMPRIALEDITKVPAPTTAAELLLSSPRSIKACLKCGYDPDVLLHKPESAFARPGVSAQLQKEAYDLHEEKRKERVARAIATRDTLDDSTSILEKVVIETSGDEAKAAVLAREQARIEKIKAKQAREAESRAKLDAIRSEQAKKQAESEHKAALRAAQHEKEKRARMEAAKEAEFQKAQKLKAETERAAREAEEAAERRHAADVEKERRHAEAEKQRRKEMLAAEAERKAKAEEWRRQTEELQRQFELQ